MSEITFNSLFRTSPKLPIILQDEKAECGLACVAMISNAFGHQLSLHALRKISRPSVRGVTLKDIHRLFEHLGFRSRGLQVPLAELHLVPCPAVLHWNMNHFVVLKKVKKNCIVIHDPSVGSRTCSLEEVATAFTGIVLEVEPADTFQKICDQTKLSFLDVMRAIPGTRMFIFFLLLISITIEILSLLNPLFMQYVTDNVIGSSDQKNLTTIASGFILLTFLLVFTEYLRGNMVIYLSNHLTEKFSSNVMMHLLRLPLDFFEKRNKGDILSKFQSIENIQKKVSTDFITALLDGLMILINFGVMLIYSLHLTLTVLSSLVLFTVFRYFSYRRLKIQTEMSLYQHANAATAFLETLQCMMSIKVFLKERTRYTAWRNSYINALNADIAVSKMNVLYNMANHALFHLEHIVVICVGSGLVLSNHFSIGMLMAFLSYRLLLVNKSSSLIQNVFDYRLISIQLRRLSDILFEKQECEQVTVHKTISHPKTHQIEGSLLLNNISFHYGNSSHLILHNIKIDIRAGEKVVIVGPSGCGKSTLLKVMMGLLKKTAGEIYVDGISLDEIGLNNYREKTAAVMQDDMLLSGSILNNIVFFDEEIEMSRVYEATRVSAIHETIKSFPMGYETLVGDMGSSLSGGQKQRILLARALYRQPKILFLDESTSHLDVENENHINRALKNLAITQVIVAHRQETILMADRVIKL